MSRKKGQRRKRKKRLQPNAVLGRWRRLREVDSSSDTPSFGSIHKPVVYTNNFYTVVKRTYRPTEDHSSLPPPPIVHLAIQRNDKHPIRHRQHLQRIKNELTGKDLEGVEIFPPDGHPIDKDGSTTHLWVFNSQGFRFPYAYQERCLLENAGEGQLVPIETAPGSAENEGSESIPEPQQEEDESLDLDDLL